LTIQREPRKEGSAQPPVSCARSIPYTRAWNIAARTAHIAAMSVLVGAHAFDVAPVRLHTALWLTIVSGVVLVVLEAYSVRFRWFWQGRGLMVLVKLALLGAIPWAWSSRLPLLLAAIVLASVGSHMPARYRYYSVVDRRVL
jgi:hypothetical protein